MSIVSMESQCMKTIMIHLIDKRDHKTRCQKIIPVILVELAKSVDCDFSFTELAL